MALGGELALGGVAPAVVVHDQVLYMFLGVFEGFGVVLVGLTSIHPTIHPTNHTSFHQSINHSANRRTDLALPQVEHAAELVGAVEVAGGVGQRVGEEVHVGLLFCVVCMCVCVCVRDSLYSNKAESPTNQGKVHTNITNIKA